MWIYAYETETGFARLAGVTERRPDGWTVGKWGKRLGAGPGSCVFSTAKETMMIINNCEWTENFSNCWYLYTTSHASVEICGFQWEAEVKRWLVIGEEIVKLLQSTVRSFDFEVWGTEELQTVSQSVVWPGWSGKTNLKKGLFWMCSSLLDTWYFIEKVQDAKKKRIVRVHDSSQWSFLDISKVCREANPLT